MSADFQILSLAGKLFSSYFKKSTEELQNLGAYLFLSDESPCYPCRVSLEDAKVGERVLALEYTHHAVQSPYRSSGPIFVRENANESKLGRNELPDMLNHRFLSVRGYSDRGIMIEAETTPGSHLKTALIQQFQNKHVEYIHIHNASPGCFNCTAVRA